MRFLGTSNIRWRAECEPRNGVAPDATEPRRGSLRDASSAQGSQASDVLLGEQCGIQGDEPIPYEAYFSQFPTQPPVCRGDDELPFSVDNLTISYGKWRTERLKAFGNAWVVAVAEELFRAIERVENE